MKYKWLIKQLQELIQYNMKRGISKLPSENSLCEKYNVSRQTVRLALSYLEEEGLIEKRKGSGTYITGLLEDASKNTLGVILPDEQEYYYPQLIHDIETTATQYGFSVKIFLTHYDRAVEREVLEELYCKPLRGLLVEGCRSALPNPNIPLYQKLLKKGTSILFMMNPYESLLLQSSCVKEDNLGGSRLLVEHLLEKGHTSIGGIFQMDTIQGLERYQGFMDTMLLHNLFPKDSQIKWFDTDDIARLRYKKDIDFIKKMTQESFIDNSSAIICQNDEIAYWLQKELIQKGYHLPADLAIVSFDGSYLGSSCTPELTSLSLKPQKTGTISTRLLIDALKGLPVSTQEIPWKLHIKDSSKNPLT